MIRGTIVCGISNKMLQQKLLREAKSTLVNAVDISRAWEVTSAQAHSLQSPVANEKVHVGQVKGEEATSWS